MLFNSRVFSKMQFFIITILAILTACTTSPAQENDSRKIHLVVDRYAPYEGDTPINRLCQSLMREDPNLIIRPFVSINITGKKGDASRLLSWAGQTSPDVTFSYWHGIRTEIEQNFLCPLNEYIGYDGFYGLHPTTDKPYEMTGKPKLKIDAETGREVPDINGNIDNDETLWPEWRNYPKINRMVATVPGSLDAGPDGKPYKGAVVYGIPMETTIYYGIVYRRDLFRAAGFKEDDVPKTWDEFLYFCQRLTDPGRDVPGAKFRRGQLGFALPRQAWLWLEWLWSNNGSAIMQAKVNPATGKEHWFTQEETEFVDPETGESLALQPSRWKASFDSNAGINALNFYHKLCWQSWIHDPKTGEPVNLSTDEITQGFYMDKKTNQKVSFSSKDIIKGAVRKAVAGEDSESDMFRRGEVAMIMSNLHDLETYKIPPNNLGFFTVPAGPEGQQVVGSFRHYRALNSRLAGQNNKNIRDKAWHVISSLCGPLGRKLTVEDRVMRGYAQFMSPAQLQEFGLEEYIDRIPPHLKRQYENIIINPRTEPYMGYWYPVEVALSSKIIGFIMSREDFDFKTALKDVEQEANGRLMFGLSETIKNRYRPWAFAGVILAAFVLAFGGVLIAKSYTDKQPGDSALPVTAGTARNVFVQWLPWLLLFPALASIALWKYYPLARGSIMAFQDYHIIGASKWIGLDNFINIFTSKEFYASLVRTFKFASLSLGIGFIMPILLAILLSEVPKGKVFFRTIYFLPQLSSGLVVLFIWKLMYNPTEYGLLNKLLLNTGELHISIIIMAKLLVIAIAIVIFWILHKFAFNVSYHSRKSLWLARLLFLGAILISLFPFFMDCLRSGFETTFISWITWLWRRPECVSQDWLGDTKWAMAAVIVPGVWASAGVGSLVYLAALKNVDEESYEAADIDGAGFFDKVWYITIPYLKPLIVINFIGAFIAVFHSMSDIFAMTGGGPGDETTVLSLLIWYKAFAFLRFGEATAMAWFLGVMLIGFTIYQLRILKKVEFRRAEAG